MAEAPRRSLRHAGGYVVRDANGAARVMPDCDYALRCGHCGAGDCRRRVCRRLHRGAGCAQRSTLNKEPAEARSGYRPDVRGIGSRLRTGEPSDDPGARERKVTCHHQSCSEAL
jgi:hypothetical protein